jgi:hypothetical protein
MGEDEELGEQARRRLGIVGGVAPKDVEETVGAKTGSRTLLGA